MDAALKIVALNKWIDSWPANAARDPEARMWGRLSKVSEEAGEVIKEMIGVTNQNPRKGVYSDMQKVRKELLDVALTALCAVEHIDKATARGEGQSIKSLLWHIDATFNRAGLEEG